MTDSINKNGDHRSREQQILEQFPEEQHEQVKAIWRRSCDAAPKQEDIGHAEVEAALSQVHKRLDFGEDTQSEDEQESAFSADWKWMMAAASILIIIGAGYLFTPKTVEVPFGETAMVELPDGSTVELNSGSEMQYSRLFSLLNREVELNGEAFFKVEEAALPFLVQANDSEVKVTGTQFNIRSWRQDPGSETEVSVTEGSVLFYPENRENRSVVLLPGEFSRWARGLEAPTSPDSVSLDRVLGWRNQTFAFSKKPLDVILREMERRFDISITLEATGYGSEQVTVHYVNPEDAEVILKDICRVKGLRYSTSTDGYRIYK